MLYVFEGNNMYSSFNFRNIMIIYNELYIVSGLNFIRKYKLLVFCFLLF